MMVKRACGARAEKRAISVFEETVDGRPTYFPGAAPIQVALARPADQFRRAAVDGNQLREEYPSLASSPAT